MPLPTRIDRKFGENSLKIAPLNPKPRINRLQTAMAAVALIAMCGVAAGCGNKDAAPTASVTPAASGPAKPTPAQQAAIQKAIAQGPAVAAAFKKSQGGQ
jgi:hypothetical protein